MRDVGTCYGSLCAAYSIIELRCNTLKIGYKLFYEGLWFRRVKTWVLLIERQHMVDCIAMSLQYLCMFFILYKFVK